jgi:hypothetical protein
LGRCRGRRGQIHSGGRNFDIFPLVLGTFQQGRDTLPRNSSRGRGGGRIRCRGCRQGCLVPIHDFGQGRGRGCFIAVFVLYRLGCGFFRCIWRRRRRGSRFRIQRGFDIRACLGGHNRGRQGLFFGLSKGSSPQRQSQYGNSQGEGEFYD